MSKSQTILILISLLVATLAQDDNWAITWKDEFDGSNVDTSKWKFETGNNNGWGNNELEYYTKDPGNVFIKDGKLVIQAKKEDKEGFHYTSARLDTSGKFSTTYGKFEIRAKLPTGKGLWPAFWLLGDNIDQVGWPACGEIDIMEWVGKDPNNVHFSTHGTGFDTTNQSAKDGGWNDGQFHTYGVNWQPDSLEFYVDGQTKTKVTPADLNGAQWPFNNNKMFIVVNMAVGGGFAGDVDGSTQFPQQFVIEYVRVYEKKNGKAVDTAVLATSNAGRRVCKKRNLRR